MEKKNNKFLIYIDIISIFKTAYEVQWHTLRENSIYRILYFSSVFHSFIFNEDEENPFSIYNFSLNSQGPYDSNVADAINFLVKDEYIVRTEGDDTFSLGTNQANRLEEFDVEKERSEWIKVIIHILGLYGENKIYEFIFRDPEYQIAIKSNTNQTLNTNLGNSSVETLNKFKSAFEESLGDNKNKINSQTYLELYFEYVFGKILKRED